MTVPIGRNASYFYNLWEIGMLQLQPGPPPPGPSPPPVNCSTQPMMCGVHGTCVNGGGSRFHPGFSCVCAPRYGGPYCSQLLPRNCSQVRARASCENHSVPLPARSLPDCKWVVAESRCTQLQSPGASPAQGTEIAEVGLFGFPEFSRGPSSRKTASWSMSCQLLNATGSPRAAL